MTDSARPLATLVLLVLLSGCSSSDDLTPVGVDGPAPAAIADLEVVAGAPRQLTFRFTAPPAPATDKAVQLQAEFRRIALGDEDAPMEAWRSFYYDGVGAGEVAEFTIDALPAEGAQVYAVRTQLGAGPFSAPSNFVVATAAVDHDRTRPAPVTGLRLWEADLDLLTVAWAPAGDDSIYGQAAAYEVRWSTAPIDMGNWEAATAATGPTVPCVKPGLLQTTIDGLAGETDHWVAVRARDDAGLLGGLAPALAANTDTMRIWYVNVEGTGTVPTIDEAVKSARRGDTVLVAPGRYTWTDQGTGHELYGMVHVPKDHVGFSMISEAGPEATIIDAEGLGPCMHITGASLGTGDDGPTWPGILVEGFTFTGGVALGEAGNEGGAYAGGGLVFHLSNATIRNCIMTGNRATQGGGVWYGGQGIPVIEDCLIENNEAVFGGGLFLINNKFGATVRGCTIRNNVATGAGGGFSAYNIKFLMENTTISGNVATGDVELVGLEAGAGGGMLLLDSTYRMTVRDVDITGNTGEYGGALRVLRARFDFERVLMAGNRGNRQGGGVMAEALPDSCAMTRVTIADNHAVLGGAMRLVEAAVFDLRASIVTGNTGNVVFSTSLSGSGFRLECSDVWGNPSGTAWPGFFADLGGNFAADPRFCGSGDYGLLADSPCLAGQHPDGTGCGGVGARAGGCGG